MFQGRGRECVYAIKLVNITYLCMPICQQKNIEISRIPKIEKDESKWVYRRSANNAVPSLTDQSKIDNDGTPPLC